MNNPSHNLIFLISQPRAGSTLTQRILGAHSQIHTQSEPWIMLHPLNALKSDNIQTAYDINLYIKGAADFIDHLPGKMKLYKTIISEAYQNLYSSILDREKKSLFLDKTPRYYYIINELSDFFPKAKFIFLWRNPAAVLTSIVKTWSKADWYRLSEWKDDLLYAPKWMLNGIDQLKSKALVLSYEELLKNPEAVVRMICKFLAVPYEEKIIEYGQFKVPAWQYGDQVTVNQKGKPDNYHADTWLTHLNNPQMWRVISDYLHYLGSELISSMGYDSDEMKGMLEQNKPNLDIELHTLPLTELINTNRDILIENKRLHKDLRSAFDGLRTREENLKVRNETIAQKDKFIAEKDRIIQQSKIELAKNQVTLEEKKTLIDKLQSIISEKDKQIERSISDQNALAKNMTEKDLLLEKRNNELFKLKEEMNAGLLQNEKQSEEIKKMCNELTSLKLSLKDKESQVVQLGSEGSSLKLSLKDKESQVVQLGSEVSSLKLSLSDKESHAEKMNSMIAGLKNELEMSKDFVEKLQNQLTVLHDKLKATEESKFRMQKENEDKLNESIHYQKKQIQELKDFIKGIEKSYTFRVGKVIISPARRIKKLFIE